MGIPRCQCWAYNSCGRMADNSCLESHLPTPCSSLRSKCNPQVPFDQLSLSSDLGNQRLARLQGNTSLLDTFHKSLLHRIVLPGISGISRCVMSEIVVCEMPQVVHRCFIACIIYILLYNLILGSSAPYNMYNGSNIIRSYLIRNSQPGICTAEAKSHQRSALTCTKGTWCKKCWQCQPSTAGTEEVAEEAARQVPHNEAYVPQFSWCLLLSHLLRIT